MALLALRRDPQGDSLRGAGIEPLHDPLDHTALPGSVAALENHGDPQAPRLDPLL